MAIYKVNENDSNKNKISNINDMVMEVNGKVNQGKFNKFEIDALYNDLGVSRKYLRSQTVGGTASTYTGWTHIKEETGYSIWRFQ